MSNEEKTEILIKSAENAANFTDFGKTFEKTCILYGIRFNLSPDEIRKILENNSEEIGIDFDILTGVSNLNAVYLKIAGQSYTSFDEVVGAFEKAVNECKNEKKKSNGSTSSGGSKSVNTPSIVPPTTNTVFQEPQKQIFFDDIDGHWAEKIIYDLYEKGIVSGKGENLYAPDEFVTREEFLKMVVTILNPSEYEKAVFTDVDENAWYYEYICKGVGASLINGKDDGSFGIGTKITREDAAVIIFRAFEDMRDMERKLLFNDEEEISDYAKEAVAALSELGIINGDENGNFAPKANATRAETAAIVARTVEYIGG